MVKQEFNSNSETKKHICEAYSIFRFMVEVVISRNSVFWLPNLTLPILYTRRIFVYIAFRVVHVPVVALFQ